MRWSVGVAIMLTALVGNQLKAQNMNNSQNKVSVMESQIAIGNYTPANWDGITATDPELADIIRNFAYGDTQQYGSLDTQTRILVTMASSVALGARSEFGRTVEEALADCIDPVVIKEVVYHAIPYCGFARAEDLLIDCNETLSAHGIALPLEPQNVVTHGNRLEKGRELQDELFGHDGIQAGYDNAPPNQIHINKFLSANCFGDYQTRPALGPRLRELLTFAILASLGGCEPQLKSHIAANVSAGNDKAVLLTAITQLLPYIGYPRTLNAISCINAVVPEN